MNPSEDRRRAGVFLLAALSLLAVVVATLAGVRLMSRERVYYVEFMESVSGLEPSSPVKYNGVPAGTVASIQFKPWDVARILVEIRIKGEVPIKADTRAQLKPQGITGIFYLELYGGTQDAAEMPEGETIPSDPSLTSAITGIAKNLGELVEQLNRFFAVNSGPLTEAVTDLRAAMASARGALERLETLVASGEAAMADVRTAVAGIRSELETTGKSVREAVGALEEFLEDPALRQLPKQAGEVLAAAKASVEGADLPGLAEEARAAVAEFRDVEASLARAADSLAAIASDAGADVGAALRNIRVASDHVREATRRLRDDPGRLLRSPQPADKPVPDPLPAEEAPR